MISAFRRIDIYLLSKKATLISKKETCASFKPNRDEAHSFVVAVSSGGYFRAFTLKERESGWILNRCSLVNQQPIVRGHTGLWSPPKSCRSHLHVSSTCYAYNERLDWTPVGSH